MSDNPNILNIDDLKKVTCYKYAGDVEKCLKKQGIRFFFGKNGPWTTIDLINAAGGIRPVELPKTGSEGIL